LKFRDLLLEAIGRSEIPLRFEPGAEEAVATPVTELIRAWLLSHSPDPLIEVLLEELNGTREIRV
jgi:hypothetical protein